MKKILFATGNQRKIGEAELACRDFGIEIEQVKLEIDEIQAHDPIVIAEHKAKEAYRLAKRPVVITDTSWRIPALGGFPGGYMKDVSAWFEPSDFVALMSIHDDKRAYFTEAIYYTDEKGSKVFSQEYEGRIIDSPRGSGESFEQIMEFDGYTIGERREQGRFSHDPEDYIWHRFATWYSGK